MKLAIIGCGEVGRLYARAASAHFEVVLCDSRPAPAARELAADLGLPLHESAGEWLATVDRVWSCVTGDVAATVADLVSAHLRAGAMFVDMSTATPADKLSSAGNLSGRGVEYADAVIMGAIGLTGLGTALLVSGAAAAVVVEDFAAVGAPARALDGGRPGDAAALKLLRTVLTKGLEALGVECLVAAEKQGVRDELYRVLADIDTQGLTSFLNAVVRTHLLHAERRSHEVERAVAQLDQAHLPSSVLAGSYGLYERTVQSLAQNPPEPGTADSIDSAVTWLLSVSDTDSAVTV
ncbi:NAD(P)-dependent oxidoreductase [Rhodococcus sp. WS4]|nr:NAD(P)-dependent oxidoreductase [Rhodococcus sp. WS4]